MHAAPLWSVWCVHSNVQKIMFVTLRLPSTRPWNTLFPKTDTEVHWVQFIQISEFTITGSHVRPTLVQTVSQKHLQLLQKERRDLLGLMQCLSNSEAWGTCFFRSTKQERSRDMKYRHPWKEGRKDNETNVNLPKAEKRRYDEAYLTLGFTVTTEGDLCYRIKLFFIVILFRFLFSVFCFSGWV